MLIRFQAFECSVLLKRLKTLFRGDLSIKLQNNLSIASYFSYGLNFFITYAVNVWYRIVFCFEYFNTYLRKPDDARLEKYFIWRPLHDLSGDRQINLGYLCKCACVINQDCYTFTWLAVKRIRHITHTSYSLIFMIGNAIYKTNRGKKISGISVMNLWRNICILTSLLSHTA